MTDAEKAALAWLDEMARHSAHVRHAIVVQDMLATSVMPAEPTQEILAVMQGAYARCPMGVAPIANAYHALRAMLSMPATTTINVWHVEYAVSGDGGKHWMPSLSHYTSHDNAARSVEEKKRDPNYRCVRMTGPHEQEIPT
jgi:hypothetical protein